MTYRATRIALLAAATAVGAQLRVPLPFTPVPIVLSNLVAVLSGFVLGPADGAVAQAVYVGVGVIGAPVFAGPQAGLTVLLGPTGGYLVWFILAAWLAGKIVWEWGRKGGGAVAALASACGFAVIYVTGLPWLAVVTHLSGMRLLMAGFVPFVPGDCLKALAVAVVAPRIAAAGRAAWGAHQGPTPAPASSRGRDADPPGG